MRSAFHRAIVSSERRGKVEQSRQIVDTMRAAGLTVVELGLCRRDGCREILTRKATGPPGLYCSARCRVAAMRKRKSVNA